VSLRTRLTLASAGAVFAALTIASLVIYFDVRSKLHDQVDVSLIQSAQTAAAGWAASKELPKAGAKGLPKIAAKVVPRVPPAKRAHLLFGKTSDGLFQVVPRLSTGPSRSHSAFVPFGPRDESVARGLSPPYFQDVRLGGVAQRIYTMRLPASSAGVVQTIRPLTETNATIANVRRLLIALTLGGALAAALLGGLAAGAVLRPVRALAGAVRQVTATRDLNRRIEVSGRDEVGSLATDFNGMLAALDASQRAQQQLIADASHELRTPLAAHRANVELLARPDLPAELRPRVLAAAVRGIEELSTLVGDLIQAARDGRSVDAREPLALEELVTAAVERARHRAPGLRFDTQLEPYRVVAARSRLERTIDNVLDNAIKWSPPGGTVDTRLAAGVLTVRDHGPGIAEADLPHVFDRFYRAAAARALPGSGLGLAIVKETVDDHDGDVAATNADGGGALLTLRFDPSNGRP
jgi:two-component system, OmpR family, sensor histidine kinase MprB